MRNLSCTAQCICPALLIGALVVLVPNSSPLCAGEIGLNIYGLSYHVDRRDEMGNRFNEFNYGLGASYTFYSNDRSRYYLEGGIYYDSFRTTARYGTVGYDYRLFDRLYFGVIVGLIDSRSVTPSGSIVAAVPLIRYRLPRVSVSLVHLPEFPGINSYPSFATYLTLWFGKVP